MKGEGRSERGEVGEGNIQHSTFNSEQRMAKENGEGTGGSEKGEGRSERGEGMGGLAPLLTIPQVAGVLGLKRRTLEEWVRGGRIKHYRVGRSIRFKAADVEQFLETRCRVGRGNGT